MRARFLSASVALLLAAAFVLPYAHADLISTIEHPTRVPSFSFISLGNGIEPGSSGTYGFSLTNRYNSSIDNVSLTIEIARWGTVEFLRNLSEVPNHPTFAAGGTLAHLTFPTIAPNASVQIRLDILAPDNTLEGVYFTRHLLEFDYSNVTEPPAPRAYTDHFVMKSRGYFTDAEWASLDYTDLQNSLAALNISGIIPDSSFSVKRAAPVWPLATIIVVAALAGLLAFAYALVDQRAGKYPRVERSLLRMEGKVTVWKALARVRLRKSGNPPKDPPKGSP